jgi:uncharacterized damage-inducible protein DinB
MELFVQECLARLEQSLGYVEKSIVRLDRDMLWKRIRPGMNAVGNLCLHIAGNEYQHFVSAIGGNPFVRNRPAEFQTEQGGDGAELLSRLQAVRRESRAILEKLSASDLDRPVEVIYSPDAKVESYTWPIRKILLVVTEHYAYHTGQIVLLAKLLQEEDRPILHWKH